MPENMMCSSQKANSKEFRDNYDGIFKNPCKPTIEWVIEEVCRKLDSPSLADNFKRIRFVLGVTGIICEFCNFPMLMAPFEWESELKRCDNCKTQNELRTHLEVIECLYMPILKEEDENNARNNP